MNVLITRPTGQSAPLVRLLHDAGLQTTLLPLLDILPVDLDPQTRTAILNLDRYQGVVVISPNAAQFGLALVEAFWPQLPVQQNWFANGKATADILSRAGIQVHTPLSGTTTEDIIALPALAEIAGQDWLIIGGQGGRPLLTDTLIARGAQVTKLAVYQRRCPDISRHDLSTALETSDILLMSSAEALENLHQIATSTKMDTDSLLRKILVVSSKRLADIATSKGWKTVVVAQGASNEQLTEATLSFISTSG